MTIKEWQALVADNLTELAIIRRVQADAVRDAAREPKWGSERFIEADRLLRYADEIEAGKD